MALAAQFHVCASSDRQFTMGLMILASVQKRTPFGLAPTGMGIHVREATTKRRGSPAAGTNKLASVRPPLKWAGGKRWLVPYLKPLFEAHGHRRLVEAFCGSAAITLGLQPERALLNDINPHLINFCRWVRRGLVVTRPFENDARTYYSHRARFNELIRTGHTQTQEAAALFYYLNRNGYNGLCRFNRQGLFNVPFGHRRTISYQNLRGYRSAFRGFTLENKDFEALDLQPDDFIYADPPYDGGFTGYNPHAFIWNDQVRLARWLARHPGTVVVSNHATERVVDLYQNLGFRVEFILAPRRVNCTGSRSAHTYPAKSKR